MKQRTKKKPLKPSGNESLLFALLSHGIIADKIDVDRFDARRQSTDSLHHVLRHSKTHGTNLAKENIGLSPEFETISGPVRLEYSAAASLHIPEEHRLVVENLLQANRLFHAPLTRPGSSHLGNPGHQRTRWWNSGPFCLVQSPGKMAIGQGGHYPSSRRPESCPDEPQ